jgi:hypothetical protein
MEKTKIGVTRHLSRIDGIVVETRNQQDVALADYVKVSMATIGRISRLRNRPGSRSLK